MSIHGRQQKQKVEDKLRKEERRERARREDWDLSASGTDTVKVNCDGAIILMDRTTAYALMNAREAKMVLDQDTKVDYVAAHVH